MRQIGFAGVSLGSQSVYSKPKHTDFFFLFFILLWFVIS